MCIGINNLTDALLEASANPVWIKDLHQNYLQVNHAFLSAFQLDIINVISKNTKEVWQRYSFQPDAYDQEILATLKTKTYDAECQIEDVICRYSITSVPYHIDGVLSGVVSIAVDISAQCFHNNAVLNSLLDHLPYGIIITDRDKHIIEADHFLEEFFELTCSLIGLEYSYLAKNCSILDTVHSDVGPQSDYEILVHGRVKFFTVTTIPIYDQEGVATGEIHFFTNFR